MKIPTDFADMYELCLNQSARGIVKMSISPEYIMTLIERIADLEQENTKREIIHKASIKSKTN